MKLGDPYPANALSVGVMPMVCLASWPMLFEEVGDMVLWLLMVFKFLSGCLLRGCDVVAVRNAAHIVSHQQKQRGYATDGPHLPTVLTVAGAADGRTVPDG
jgi:hypothetical protein